MTQGSEGLLRQAAAICYRLAPGKVEFLLVRTMDEFWTFAKGHIEPGQTTADAAEMEAYEEAGVFGDVDSVPLTSYYYSKSREGDPPSPQIEVAAHLLRVRQSFPPRETFRRPQWFTPQMARAALTEKRNAEDAQEMARVLALAERRLTTLEAR